MQTHQGAVMIADITGFTALTEELGRQGAAGVELLTSCMNNFFTLVIDLVSSTAEKCGKRCISPWNLLCLAVRCGPPQISVGCGLIVRGLTGAWTYEWHCSNSMGIDG